MRTLRYRSGTKVGGAGKPSGTEGLPSAEGGEGLSGKYQPFATLGEGGMAQVFLAVARGPQGFNKLVVLKRMRAQLAQDEALVTMFLDEARLAARLNHPNVVHTYEIGEHKGLYFIAMEYLDGQPLNRILSEAHRAEHEVRPAVWMRIIGDALLGLHYAHTLKDYDGTPLDIVHRDVSPHNVFVTYDGQAKVVDFGIAKAVFSRTQTDAGALKGKIAYMSPEQARGERLDRRSDVFAMGIVLWEALAGRKLFGHELAGTTLHKLLNSNAPRLSSVLPEVDPQLDALVAKALARDVAERFQSAQEMRESLEDWMRERGEVVRQDEVGDLVSDLFDAVRLEAQRQIQVHMAAIAADPSSGGNLDAMSSAATWDAGADGLPALHLAGGSGSAMVRQALGGTLDPAAVARQRRRVTLAVVVTFATAVVVTLVVGLGLVRRNAASGIAGASSPVPSEPRAADEVPPPQPTPPVPAASPTPSDVPVPAVPAVTAAPVASPARAPSLVAKTATASRATASPSIAVAPAEPGFLTFDTYPWTRVSEDGRVIGDTPLVHRQLPAGPHVLTLDNPEQNIHQTYPVTIASGETVSRRLGLK